MEGTSVRRTFRSALVVLLAWIAFVFVNNTNLFATRAPGQPVLLAHRGIAQRFDTTELRGDTCTAARMLAPQHAFLENTIASMRAAFEAGADVVELDVHPTTDGQFAVFHDWTLDCRTDGKGVTRAHAMTELRTLDIGYGYTADGGRTFPFRGKGIGLMPSLDDVLSTFPGREFLINVKSNDPREGVLLAVRLSKVPAPERSRLMAYGGDEPIAALHERLPDLRTLSRESIKRCLLSYIGLGWSGYVPSACRNALVLVPINVAPWLWGWPDRFLDRMENAGSRVFVQGDYHGGGWSSGIDTPRDLARLPAGYSGGILTDEIEAIAGAAKPAQRGQ
jgi:glycerophosphoryl diester phosphodiesterase